MKGPYQVYFERARVPIVAVDGLGRIRESNPAFQAALGRDAAALLGRPAEELLAPGEREAQWPHWRLLATGRLNAYRTWMRLLRGDRTVIVARVSASVEPRRNGLPWRAVAVLEEVAPEAPALSLLQREVLRLVAAGASNREIARQLYLTRQAVDYHLARLRAKLGAGSRSALVGRAFVLGVFVHDVWPPTFCPARTGERSGPGGSGGSYSTPRN
ncbi:hypothetical protein GCM10010156_44340 [Planobispora rosea]|uniref:HTH luxR-type domain-containing protein n=1 Tax=Planobispora rosea TaxID=35762 RepID=A0A8J3S4I0_PLARO|nr:LuxR C-terminal-related transcriptional regulator [Planobispora rosea]GGS80687.1 hypothetical protein GCM10010156_44340 [Planobispora rosea]GIH85975.1 hypothetical protein Pro02_43830 [Planobispora rosea]